MYRALVIAAMAGAVLGGVIAPQNDISTRKSHQLQLDGPLTNSESNNQAPIYPGTNQLKETSQQLYYIPTYPEYHPENGVPVQNGYDAYLIPVAPPKRTSGWTTSVLSSLVPFSSQALSYSVRIGAYIWNFFLLLLIGGILTTSICTFTPFCTITFLGLGLTKNQVREQVSELARTYITPESMNSVTLLVKSAIDKYTELQQQQREVEEMAKKEKRDEKRRRR